nr:MAG TPA: hypothetical protein [Caudoviricetes sp.]
MFTVFAVVVSALIASLITTLIVWLLLPREIFNMIIGKK